MIQTKQDLISIRFLTQEQIEQILLLAEQFSQSPPLDLFKGYILGCCFFEPSTRTRLSFETAMKRLGGQTIGFSDIDSTSTHKGESLLDTMRVVSEYADAIVLRHPKEGAAAAAAEVVGCPVINAGDGANQHPTQTLLDLYTIQQSQGRLNDLRIGFLGDLRYGRTVHSLVQAAMLYGNRLYFVSPPGLELPPSMTDFLKQKEILFSFHESIEEVIEKLDILYVTRLQKERMPKEGVQPLKYSVNLDLLRTAKENLRILHPLPRVNEIDHRIDRTPFASYFQQAAHGMLVRQAILAYLLNLGGRE